MKLSRKVTFSSRRMEARLLFLASSLQFLELERKEKSSKNPRQQNQLHQRQQHQHQKQTRYALYQESQRKGIITPFRQLNLKLTTLRPIRNEHEQHSPDFARQGRRRQVSDRSSSGSVS